MGNSRDQFKIKTVQMKKVCPKDKTLKDRNPENAPDYEEKMIKLMNKLNNTNHTKYSELGAMTVQVPPEILGRNGEPVGKMINQSIYYVANDDMKSARNCMKSLGYSGLQAKIYCKDEKQLQRRHPEEVAKYKGKPMPEEFKLLTERLN